MRITNLMLTAGLLVGFSGSALATLHGILIPLPSACIAASTTKLTTISKQVASLSPMIPALTSSTGT